MLRVVCWLWSDPDYRWNDRFRYTADHVNRLRSMVARNLAMPHEFCCITDDGSGLDSGIRVIPLWNDLRGMGGCYVRLRAFSGEMAKIIGPRFVSLDVDCVVTGDLTPLFARPDDFVIWRDANYPRQPYCGSMFLMTAGARERVWRDFRPDESPKAAREKGYVGTDQAWIAECLGPGEATWGRRDGVLSFSMNVEPATKLPGRAARQGRYGHLPEHARIVFFHGPHDPSEASAQARHPWIEQHWR